MHQSRYTVAVPCENGEYLLYNTVTGSFAALDAQAYACFEAADGPFVRQLAEADFLTDLSPEQELAAVQARFDAARADTSKLTLNFVPTYACNYRCPYCYEKGHNGIPGKMDASVVASICDFVQALYAQQGFTSMYVQWYGGDPSLALDVVEELSDRLIAFCAEHGIAYDAMMLSNATLIDAPAASLIADCRISQVLLTIDGPEEVHNKRRVAANGTNSYEHNIQAARFLRERGIDVHATMNVDKVNWPFYESFRTKLLADEGISLSVGKLCDYGHFYGEDADFKFPEFDLFTHEEFFQERLALFEQQPHSAAEMREMLRPIDRFCTGQLDNYFVIDLLGDVYNCDGWVGDRKYVRFNLADGPDGWLLHDISHDATRDAKCSACKLLPVCFGSCIWERVCNGMPCHPFKTTIGGYLRVYRSCFPEVAAPVEGFVLLAE